MREQLISYITSLLSSVSDYSKRQILQGFLNYLQANVSITTQELETIRNVVNNIATEAATAPQPQGFVFKQIDDVVYNTRNIAVPGFWDKSGVIEQSDFYYRPTDPDHYNDLFVNVFKGSATVDPEFSIAFASKNNYGGGATSQTTRKHYLAFVNQFKPNLASDIITVPVDPDNLGAGFHEVKNFVIISFHNFADTIDVGNFQINLAAGTAALSATLSLVDNSNETNLATPIRTQLQPYYYLVSGSLVGGKATPVTHSMVNKVFGIVYPQSALLLLDMDIFGNFLSHSGVVSGVDGYAALNNLDLAKYPISTTSLVPPGAIHKHFADLIHSITLSMVDNVHSLLIFCRVKADEFNYSLNPTFYDPLSGRILYPDQGTYITTVGIYDQNNQLVAIGRLSSPLRKTSEDEYVIKLKVEF